MDLRLELHLRTEQLTLLDASLLDQVELFANETHVDRSNVNEKDRTGKTLLHRVLQKQDEFGPAMVRLLIKKGVDVNTKDEAGVTPLHLAAGSKHASGQDIVRLLLANGASSSINDKTRRGLTPLHLAVRNQHESASDIVRLLLENGANYSIHLETAMKPTR